MDVGLKVCTSFWNASSIGHWHSADVRRTSCTACAEPLLTCMIVVLMTMQKVTPLAASVVFSKWHEVMLILQSVSQRTHHVDGQPTASSWQYSWY